MVLITWGQLISFIRRKDMEKCILKMGQNILEILFQDFLMEVANKLKNYFNFMGLSKME